MATSAMNSLKYLSNITKFKAYDQRLRASSPGQELLVVVTMITL